jgi:hypothetical protein
MRAPYRWDVSQYHDGISYDATRNPGGGGRMVVKAKGSGPKVGVLTDFFTFTGDNQSMFRGASGLLVPSVTNAPRIEYSTTGNVLGLLTEGARTNSELDSADLTTANWTKQQSTIGANVIAAPDGTITADKIQEDNTSAGHSVFNAGPSAAGNADTVVGCYSVFLKAAERSRVLLVLGAAASGFSTNSAIAVFDLSAGTVVTSSVIGLGSITATGIQSFANGWYRCWIAGAANEAATNHLPYIFVDDGTHTVPTNYTGVTGNGVYAWGAQFEAGASFPSSYIPTTTASVTRAAGKPIRTFGAEYIKTAGTTFVEFDRNTLAVGITYGILGVGNAGRNLYITATGGHVGQVAIYDGTTEAHSTGTAMTVNVMAKAASSFDSAGMSVTLSGATVVTAAFDGVFAAAETQIAIGDIFANANSQLFGHIRRLDYWPERKANMSLVRQTVFGSLAA